MQKVTITQIRSTIGVLQSHKNTMKALGLRKINHSVEHAYTPSIQGMLKQVGYLVNISIK